jgi:hypothetical protein
LLERCSASIKYTVNRENGSIASVGVLRSDIKNPFEALKAKVFKWQSDMTIFARQGHKRWPADEAKDA